MKWHRYTKFDRREGVDSIIKIYSLSCTTNLKWLETLPPKAVEVFPVSRGWWIKCPIDDQKVLSGINSSNYNR